MHRISIAITILALILPLLTFTRIRINIFCSRNEILFNYQQVIYIGDLMNYLNVIVSATLLFFPKCILSDNSQEKELSSSFSFMNSHLTKKINFFIIYDE